MAQYQHHLTVHRGFEKFGVEKLRMTAKGVPRGFSSSLLVAGTFGLATGQCASLSDGLFPG